MWTTGWGRLDGSGWIGPAGGLLEPSGNRPDVTGKRLSGSGRPDVPTTRPAGWGLPQVDRVCRPAGIWQDAGGVVQLEESVVSSTLFYLVWIGLKTSV
jgi:hypothetical protein